MTRRRRFDIVVMGDFRFRGGTSTAVAAELRALATTSYSVAVYQQPVPQFTHIDGTWNRHVRAVVEECRFPVVPSGEPIDAELLVAHSPWLFAQRSHAVPAIRSKLRLLVVHHPPSDARGRLLYDPWTTDANARGLLGGDVIWAPNSPTCRASFDRARLPFLRLDDDWTNVIFVDDWGAARDGLLGQSPVIGRHSLPRPEKWPRSTATIHQAYRPGEAIAVRLMGVPDAVIAAVGGIPPNWTVLAENEVPVRDFVNSIDFFVYFHAPDWVETFGRAPAEAISAGCVAILPPYLEATFGPAALYCEPKDAMATIQSVLRVPGRFAELSRDGRRWIERHYGPHQHLERIDRTVAAALGRLDPRVICSRTTTNSRSAIETTAARAAYRARTLIERPANKIRRVVGRTFPRLGR